MPREFEGVFVVDLTVAQPPGDKNGSSSEQVSKGSEGTDEQPNQISDIGEYFPLGVGGVCQETTDPLIDERERIIVEIVGSKLVV